MKNLVALTPVLGTILRTEIFVFQRFYFNIKTAGGQWTFVKLRMSLMKIKDYYKLSSTTAVVLQKYSDNLVFALAIVCVRVFDMTFFSRSGLIANSVIKGSYC